MVTIRPFRALRPSTESAAQVAALPYDVYSRKEARKVVENNPMSFLAIDRAETQFPENQDIYAPCVYEKAASLLREYEQKAIFIQEDIPCYYIWELTMDQKTQTGLVALSSVDDYLRNIVKKHETTRKDKEEDRFRHIDATSAQTGPIFLAYRSHAEITALLEQAKRSDCLYDFTADDGVHHRVWRIDRPADTAELTKAFSLLEHTYIADGHHRAASAVSVSQKRRGEHPGYTGKEEFNYFLSVLFPDDQLRIMDYNRVLKDLNGYSAEEILDQLRTSFDVSEAECAPYRPCRKGEFGFYLDETWYLLKTRPERMKNDPIGVLDVEYLQREALAPIWGIRDPRTDDRIDFVGGIRGLGELERRCHMDCAAAFSLYPTSIGELFRVADADLLMPPKSTWFEPKLRSGLFIHKIEK